MAKSTGQHEQLRGFSLAVIDFLAVPISKEAVEPIRTTKHLRGLREAARDMVEMCQDISPAQVAALDARLVRGGFPTLSLMRDRRYRSLLAVLSRGRIDSETEFRLVTAYLSDVESSHFSDSARANASAMQRAYEFAR